MAIHNNYFSTLRRLYGLPLDYLLRFLRAFRNLYNSYLLNKEIEESKNKFLKRMKMSDFLRKDFYPSKNYTLWNSSIEDDLLRKNYGYSVNFKKHTVNFDGKESEKRWLGVLKKLKQLRILSKNDYIVDIGCSTGGFVNGLALAFDCRTIGIDINVDRCLEYAKKFKIRNAKFKQLSMQDLIKISFNRKFKLVIFTYQSHGDIRWLSSKRLHLDFFKWLKHNANFVLMEDPKNKIAMPKSIWFKEITTVEGGFNVKHPLKIYRVK